MSFRRISVSRIPSTTCHKYVLVSDRFQGRMFLCRAFLVTNQNECLLRITKLILMRMNYAKFDLTSYYFCDRIQMTINVNVHNCEKSKKECSK